MRLFAFTIRLFRLLRCRCLVCSKRVGSWRYRYCSFECACYDGAFTVRNGMEKEPSLWYGYTEFQGCLFHLKKPRLERDSGK